MVPPPPSVRLSRKPKVSRSGETRRVFCHTRAGPRCQERQPFPPSRKARKQLPPLSRQRRPFGLNTECPASAQPFITTAQGREPPDPCVRRRGKPHAKRQSMSTADGWSQTKYAQRRHVVVAELPDEVELLGELVRPVAPRQDAIVSDLIDTVIGTPIRPCSSAGNPPVTWSSLFRIISFGKVVSALF